ncbi:hypothetical protein ACIBTV_25570 [Micromonospora sp. NPDC049366]|uniref:hypothetical protein n=1 Tax=Micromonospora sp. NPDC049366 TaxID=3364271 RepID=UPI0037BDA2E9
MDKQELGRLLEAYCQEYRRHTTHHAAVDIAARWWRLSLTLPEVTATVAASWARLDFYPEEAEPLIRSGITPRRVREVEQHARGDAGSRKALIDQRIQQMVQAGQIVDPAQVARVQDPSDPTREIIAIRNEPDERRDEDKQA